MRELALHILDIAQNSVAAKAKNIWLTINEDQEGFFLVKLRDDGCGMDEEMARRVRDPFVTTRTTRKVGLGLPFMDMVTQLCGGHLDITSKVGQGTEIAAYFGADNLDRPPLGDLVESIKVLMAGAPWIDLQLDYTAKGGRGFKFTTKEMRGILGEACDFTNPDVYGWLEGYLRQQLEVLKQGEVFK